MKDDPNVLIGSHGQLTSLTTVQIIPRPFDANYVLLQASGNSIRFTLDGATAPTASKGFVLAAGQTLVVEVAYCPSIRVIEVSPTAVLDYQFFKGNVTFSSSQALTGIQGAQGPQGAPG